MNITDLIIEMKKHTPNNVYSSWCELIADNKSASLLLEFDDRITDDGIYLCIGLGGAGVEEIVVTDLPIDGLSAVTIPLLLKGRVTFRVRNTN